jgi:hypothetical protein
MIIIIIYLTQFLGMTYHPFFLLLSKFYLKLLQRLNYTIMKFLYLLSHQIISTFLTIRTTFTPFVTLIGLIQIN